MTVYIRYDKQPPHLPVAIADSKEELAAMIGMSINCVRSSFSHGLECFAAVDLSEPDVWPDNDGGLWTYDENGRAVCVE